MILLSTLTIAGSVFEERICHGGGIIRSVDGKRVHTLAEWWHLKSEADQRQAAAMPPDWLSRCKEAVRAG